MEVGIWSGRNSSTNIPEYSQSQLIIMPLKRLALLLGSLVLTIFFIPEVFVYNPGFGRDPSWEIALHMAVKNKLLFGKDFIFTYGPLGFLYTRLSIGVFAYTYILFDLFILANTMYVIYNVLSRTKLALSIKVIIASMIVFHGDVSIHLLLLLVFFLFHYIESHKKWILINIIAIATVALFVKLSTGFLPFIFIPAFLVYCLNAKLLTIKQSAVLLISHAVLILIFSIVLHVDFLGYLSNGLSVISGYSDGMYLDRRNYNYSLVMDLGKAIACATLLIIPFLIYLKRILKNKQTLLLYFTVFSTLLVLFKVALTRYNDYSFFGYVIPLTGILVIFTKVESKKIYYLSLLPIILLSLIYTAERITLPIDAVYQEQYYRGSLSLNPFARIKNYLNGVAHYQGDHPSYRAPAIEYHIPKEIIETVSGKTIDIMPWDVASLTYNNVNYSSRPVPQSIMAYTGQLDKLNASFLEKNHPDFILFQSKSIDNRYPLFDESFTKVELLSNYKTKLNPSRWNHLLLEKLDEPVSFTRTLSSQEEYALNEIIALETSEEIQMGYPEIEYSLMGKLFKFFLWSPDLTITLTLNDNSTHSFRCIKPIANAGIIINKFIQPENNQDAELFIDHYGKLSTNVKAVLFSSKSLWAFKKDFKLKLDFIKFEAEKTVISPRFRPQQISKKIKIQDSNDIKANMDLLNVDQGKVDCQGWAFVDDSLYRHLSPRILFESDKEYLLFPMDAQTYRPDVGQVFGKTAPDSVGFHATIIKRLLERKNYLIGIAFVSGDQIVKKKMLNGMFINNSLSDFSAGSKMNQFVLDKRDAEGELLYNIDILKITERNIVIGGWAALKEKNESHLDSVKILLKSEQGNYFIGNSNALVRRDVSDHFNKASLDSTGFNSTLETNSLSKGYYDLGLYVTNRKTNQSTYQFINHVAIGYPDYFLASLDNEPLHLSEITIGIDHISDSLGFFKIAGWAFVPAKNATGTEISLLLKSDDDQIYKASTKKNLRPDVTAYFKNKYQLDGSGFEIVLSKKNLEKGEYQIGIQIHYPNEKRSFSCFTKEVLKK
jgi:hypothetical protein